MAKHLDLSDANYKAHNVSAFINGSFTLLYRKS